MSRDDCTIDEHTEGDMIEQPWSLPNSTLNYHGVITQSVSLATESASLGVPTLLVSKAKRGVLTNQLVFAEKVPHPVHLARQKLADVFLDTFNSSAGATAGDALWAGLPVVTKLGKI